MTTKPAAPQQLLKEIFNRDLGEAKGIIGAWLADRMPDAKDVTIRSITPAGGLSHEILILDAAWREGGQAREQGMVIRVDPANYRKRLESNLMREYRVLGALHELGQAPVPKPLFYEEDASILGAPFLAMDKREGLIPTDTPPYQLEGWVKDLSPDARRVLWRNSVEALAKIHLTPPEKVAFLHRDEGKGNALADHLAYWKRTYDWAMGDVQIADVDACWAWLFANIPADAPIGLTWGDARWGNMMFQDLKCTTILDWEDVALASPLLDLGRWLFSNHLHELTGLPVLEGVGDRSETLALWEELTGFSARSVRWFELLTVAYGIGIVVRMTRLQVELSGRDLNPATINVDRFVRILNGWMETA